MLSNDNSHTTERNGNIGVRKMLTKCAHAYDVLHAARAPAPPLARAEARASFLVSADLQGPQHAGSVVV